MGWELGRKRKEAMLRGNVERHGHTTEVKCFQRKRSVFQRERRCHIEAMSKFTLDEGVGVLQRRAQQGCAAAGGSDLSVPT